MTREDVIRHIVERDLKKLELADDVVRREATQLHAAACEHFGTWDTALRYAGVSVRRTIVEGEYSREQVLRKIRSLCFDGYNLSSRRNVRRDWRLHAAARHHFGSWQQALRAAGINCEHIRLPSKPRRLDKQKIIAQIKQLQASGVPLTWTQICLDNRALALAAKTAFGSWRRALTAAAEAPEILPNRARRQPRWTKEVLIESVKMRQREGKGLTCSETLRDDPALVWAGQRLFGAWSGLLKAAGIVPENGTVADPEK